MLVDWTGRVLDYLRVSVTDRCNLRCSYCMPTSGVPKKSHRDILRHGQFAEVCRVARDLGFKKFRITGGEPLVVRDFGRLFAKLREATAGADLTLTTNGMLLADLAAELKAGGLDRVNISLDTLRPDRFKQLTGYDGLEQVLRAVDRCVEIGLAPIKLNVVLFRGINEDEAKDFIEFSRERDLDVRFIEWMPLPGDPVVKHEYVPSGELLESLRATYELTPLGRDGAATLYSVAGHAGRVGLIEPRSHRFCRECNRVRLTADGHLRGCLLVPGELSLKEIFDADGGRDELREAFLSIAETKPRGHRLDEELPEGTVRCMTEIGG